MKVKLIKYWMPNILSEKNYTLRKWEQKETFCWNSLKHLFNGDRHIVHWGSDNCLGPDCPEAQPSARCIYAYMCFLIFSFLFVIFFPIVDWVDVSRPPLSLFPNSYLWKISQPSRLGKEIFIYVCFFLKRTTKISLKSVTHWPKELFWTLDLIFHASLWQNIVIWSGHVDNIVVSAENHLCWTLKLKWSEFVGVICSFQTILWFVMNKGPNTIFREKFLVQATQKTHGFRTNLFPKPGTNVVIYYN